MKPYEEKRIFRDMRRVKAGKDLALLNHLAEQYPDFWIGFDKTFPQVSMNKRIKIAHLLNNHILTQKDPK